MASRRPCSAALLVAALASCATAVHTPSYFTVGNATYYCQARLQPETGNNEP